MSEELILERNKRLDNIIVSYLEGRYITYKILSFVDVSHIYKGETSDMYTEDRSKYKIAGNLSGLRRALYFYSLFVPKNVKLWLQMCGEISDTPKLRSYLRWVSSRMLRLGERVVGKSWRYYVGIHLLSGYRALLPLPDFRDEIIRWVNIPYIHRINNSEELFLTRFTRGVDYTISRLVQRQAIPEMTLYQWLKDPVNYTTSGSLYVKGNVLPKVSYTTLIDSDEGKQVLRNKWSGVFNYSLSTLRDSMTHESTPFYKVIEKQESGKIRGVISAGYELYLKMSFVGYFLDKIFMGSKIFSMYQTNRQKMLFWLRMIATTMEGKKVAFPTDYKEFDHQINFNMLRIVIDRLSTLLKRIVGNTEVHQVMRIISKDMFRGWLYLGEERIEIKNGILSGLRWTSLLDSDR